MTLSKSEAWCGNTAVFDHIGRRLSPGKTNELLSQICRVLLDRLSESGWIAAGRFIADCITSGDFHTLCDYDPDVLDLGPHDVYSITQCLAFFRKRDDIELGVDRRSVARKKFLEAERACQLTNSCFRAWEQGRFQFRPVVESVLHSSREKISRILGKAPQLHEIPVRFGPGASTQTPKKNACIAFKTTNMPACSTNLAGRLHDIAVTLPGFFPIGESDVPVHRAKLDFVPKTAKTDRAICVEPALNGLFQLGLGDLMSYKLRRVGIDIRDQSANKRAALYGSISGASATLDLSSASDTVSTSLVRHLFPPDWFELFELFRSAEIVDKGVAEYHWLEKISSMGNGFTFPLETLVFFAIASSVVEMTAPRSRIRTLVYGDDIIVDSRSFSVLCDVLRDLGFTPNPKKSFATGPFRESCGSDYVSGTNVRPVFVGSSLATPDAIVIHNFFYRRGDFAISELVRKWIAPHVRTYGPDGYGDGHLLSNVYLTRYHGKKGFSGFTFETYTKSVRSLKRAFISKLVSTSKGGRVVYKDLPQIRTLAVYTAYANSAGGTTEPEGPYRSAICQPSPESLDTDVFKTPGGGGWRRTKVYTFEAPRLGS